MSTVSSAWRSFFSRKAMSVAVMAAGMTLLAGCGGTTNTTTPKVMLQGSVQGDSAGLANYKVSLYVSDPSRSTPWVLLGSATTDSSGEFNISYHVYYSDSGVQPPLFVEAESGNVMLASAVGNGGDVPGHVVVNEMTTVAVANAFAQFINGSQIAGNTYGMSNAVHMAANLADPQTGAAGLIVSSTPNGSETTTYATFNSLANAVAACVADDANCNALFTAATSPGGSAPSNVLQALANIVKNPSYPNYPVDADDPVYQLSLVDPVYQPALTARPTNWLLFLKFTGGFYSEQDSSNLMDGPGNVAIDEKGYAWVNDNYVPQAIGDFACAGLRLMKFYPWGANYPGSPYFGGGLSGAGYGMTLDPDGHVWIGNFGFEDPPCTLLPKASPRNSVSEFYPTGLPISSDVTGYNQGNISWPQGTVSDSKGNIWIGNCGNSSLTEFPGGDPTQAINISLQTPSTGTVLKPFGVAVDADDYVWVDDNHSDTVSVVSPDGNLVATVPATVSGGKQVFTHPMGNAADIEGNIWVANSDWVDAPCPASITSLGPATNPSITMIDMKTRTPSAGSPYSGGGLTLPWGIAVDGDDTVWVFNFGPVPPPNAGTVPNGISRFCGTDTSKCPAGLTTGDAISPSTGYRSDSLERVTGGQIDPSGNIWVMNNWKLSVNPYVNPGANSIVIVVGAAGPLKTPLIGPPVPF